MDEAFDAARSKLIRGKSVYESLNPLIERVRVQDGGLCFTDKGTTLLFLFLAFYALFESKYLEKNLKSTTNDVEEKIAACVIRK